MKTVVHKCPICLVNNCFNLNDGMNNIQQIDSKWFKCSFCLKIIEKEKWI